MIDITIPGHRRLQLSHLVLDYNGTLAVDGVLEAGVETLLNELARDLKVHVVTADTFGKAARQLENVQCELSVLGQEEQDLAKLRFVEGLGADRCVCMGNGRNDQRMLHAAALGIAVILAEGAAVETLQAADIVCTGIRHGLELLRNPLRLTATLRS